MALINDVTAIRDRLEQTDLTYHIHDRGQFYIEQFMLTGSAAANLEGHISMFSGSAGGIAYLANYLLVDNSLHGEVPYEYVHPEIYVISQLVALGLGDAVIENVQNNGNGALAIEEGIEAARATWREHDPALAPYFPGNAAQAWSALGYDLGIVPPWPGDTSVAIPFVEAANRLSWLFGKRPEDFAGRAGYTQALGLGADGDSILYVVRHNGDRDGNGHIDYNDGVVVAMEEERWSYDNAEPEGWDGLWPNNWEAVREWQPLKDFRVQLTENGTTDFEQWFYTTQTGTLKNFWGSLEAMIGDTAYRNNFYFYNRALTGTEGTDYQYGGKGQDNFQGNGGNDVLDGGNNNDILHGGTGWDVLIGGSGDDILFAEDGHDSLDGGGGNDDLMDDAADPVVPTTMDGGVGTGNYQLWVPGDNVTPRNALVFYWLMQISSLVFWHLAHLHRFCTNFPLQFHNISIFSANDRAMLGIMKQRATARFVFASHIHRGIKCSAG